MDKGIARYIYDVLTLKLDCHLVLLLHHSLMQNCFCLLYIVLFEVFVSLKIYFVTVTEP